MKIIWSCGQLLEFMQEDSFSKTYAKIYWFELISEKIFLSASIGVPAGRFCENLPADNFLSVQMQTNFDINIAWSFVICKNLVYKLYTNRNEPGNMKIKWSGGQLLEFMQDASFSKIKLMQKYIDSRWFLKKSSCLQASIGVPAGRFCENLPADNFLTWMVLQNTFLQRVYIL